MQARATFRALVCATKSRSQGLICILKYAYNLTDNLDHDLELLELEEAKGPAASATAPQATHGSYQTILEVLGARLADDGLQEASYNMQDEGMTIISAGDQVMSNGT